MCIYIYISRLRPAVGVLSALSSFYRGPLLKKLAMANDGAAAAPAASPVQISPDWWMAVAPIGFQE